VAFAGLLVASRAAADGRIRLAVEWEKLGALLHAEEVPALPSWRPEADRRVVHTEPRSLLDGAHGQARWSLVARDWDAARLLMGRLAATDEVKRGRSKRMVLLRARLTEGPLAPFAQLGLGQWRIDPDTPAMPHDAVIAGQLGVGLEYSFTNWASIAAEADCTLLDPGRLEPSDPRAPPVPVPAPGGRWMHPPALWGSFLAARARF
jgi:hypothetical protein